jgi:hypothetical protein
MAAGEGISQVVEVVFFLYHPTIVSLSLQVLMLAILLIRVDLFVWVGYEFRES